MAKALRGLLTIVGVVAFGLFCLVLPSLPGPPSSSPPVATPQEDARRFLAAQFCGMPYESRKTAWATMLALNKHPDADAYERMGPSGRLGYWRQVASKLGCEF